MSETKRTPATAAYFAAFLCHGLGAAILGPTLVALAEQTGSALGQISILFFTGSLGYVAGSLLCSRLYDQLPGHRLVAGALSISAVGYIFIPLVPMLWALAALKFMIGVCGATLDSGVNTLLMWRHGKKVAPFMNALHCCFGIGAFVSPIIIAHVMTTTGGIRWSYWILAIVMAVVAIWFAILPSPSIPPHAKQPAERRRIPGTVWLVGAFLFLYVGAEIAFGGWVYTYGLSLKLANTKTAAYLTSLFWGSFTIGRLLSIPIATRVKPRLVLAGDLLGSTAALIIILLGHASPVALWTGTALFGLCMASIFPTMMAIAERRMAITGKITGWLYAGASAGAMILPTLIGQYFESIGPRIAMMAILGSMIAAAAVATTFSKPAARHRE